MAPCGSVGERMGGVILAVRAVPRFQDQINTFSNELMRGNEKLDQFKLEMNWNQEDACRASCARKALGSACMGVAQAFSVASSVA